MVVSGGGGGGGGGQDLETVVGIAGSGPGDNTHSHSHLHHLVGGLGARDDRVIDCPLGEASSSSKRGHVKLTPAKTTLCGLALFYCYQNAARMARVMGNGRERGDMMELEDDCFEDAQAATDLAERMERVVESLPNQQREALGAASKGGTLSEEGLDRLCDLLIESIVGLRESNARKEGKENMDSGLKTKGPMSRDVSERESSFSGLQGRVSKAMGEDCMEDASEVNTALTFFLQAMETPDDLNMFFLQLHKLVWSERQQHEDQRVLLNSVFEPNSLLGVFLRECCVSFELLSFEGVGRLLRKIKCYQGSHQELSTSDARDQRAEAEGGGGGGNAKMNAKLLNQFMSHVRLKDYYSALNSLHTYFDYSSGSHQGLAQMDTRLGNFEHATLEMAQLHVKFGHLSEGIKALEETLRSSQQNTNHICLIHSLALMCQVLSMPEYCFNQSKVATRGTQSDAGYLYILNNSNRKHLHSLLYHCLQRARALKLPHIEAFACVEMMKQKLLCAPNNQKTSEEMKQIGRLLDEILYVVNNESAETDSGVAALEDLGLEFNSKLNLYTDVLNTREMLRSGPGSVKGLVEDLCTTLQLLQVTRWEMKGCREYAMSLTRQVLSKDGRDAAIVLLTLYTLHQKGLDAARETLENYKSGKAGQRNGSRNHLKSKHVKYAELMIEFNQFMYVGKCCEGAKVASEMALLCTANHIFDVNIFVEAQMCKGLALMEAGENRGAQEALDVAFKVAFKSGLRRQCLECLLLFGRFYLGVGDWGSALPYVLSAYQQSKRMKMAEMEMEAVVELAQVYKATGLRERALKLLQAGDIEKCRATLQCRAKLLLATLLGTEHSEAAVEHCQAASAIASQIGHKKLLKESCWLLALFCNKVGMVEKRDQAASLFRQIDV